MHWLPEFDSLEELDEIVRELREDLNTEISQATGKAPNELWMKEKEYLHPLPTKDILSSDAMRIGAEVSFTVDGSFTHLFSRENERNLEG